MISPYFLRLIFILTMYIIWSFGQSITPAVFAHVTIKNNTLHALHERFSLPFFFLYISLSLSSYQRPEVTVSKLFGQGKHLTTNFHFFLSSSKTFQFHFFFIPNFNSRIAETQPANKITVED